MWYLLVAIAIVFFTFLFAFVQALVASIGIRATMAAWIVFALVWVLVFTFGLWKYRVLEIVDEQNKPAEKATA